MGAGAAAAATAVVVVTTNLSRCNSYGRPETSAAHVILRSDATFRRHRDLAQKRFPCDCIPLFSPYPPWLSSPGRLLFRRTPTERRATTTPNPSLLPSSGMHHPLAATRGQVTQIQDDRRTLANILLTTIKGTQIKARSIATMINPLKRPAQITPRHRPVTILQHPLSRIATPIPTTPMDIPMAWASVSAITVPTDIVAAMDIAVAMAAAFTADTSPEAATVAVSTVAGMAEAIARSGSSCAIYSGPNEGRCLLRDCTFASSAVMPDTISHHANRLLWRQLRSTPPGPFSGWTRRGRGFLARSNPFRTNWPSTTQN